MATKTSVPNTKTSKATTQKTTTKKATTKRVNGPAERLRGLQFITLGVFVILALAAAYLMRDSFYQITIGHLTNDVLASKTSTVFAPAVTALFDLNLRWWLVALLLLSTVMPLLRLTKWRQRYAEGLQDGYLAGRWIDYAVTYALMIELIALVSGVNQVMTLKLIGGFVAASFILNWLVERQLRKAETTPRTTWLVAQVCAALPWLLIGVTAVATLFYGMIRSPWYVYAVYVTTLVAVVALGWNQLNQLRAYKAWKNYVVVERNYTLINLIAKASFAVILIAGLHR